MEETKKSKQRPIIGVLLGLALLIGGTVTVLQITGSDTTKNTNAQTQNIKPDSSGTISFTAVKDKSVLEQLKANADVTVVEDPQYGPYVDAINNKKGGTDGKYWTFYVDGTMASVGAGEYKTKGGEKIEWKFE